MEVNRILEDEEAFDSNAGVNSTSDGVETFTQQPRNGENLNRRCIDCDEVCFDYSKCVTCNQFLNISCSERDVKLERYLRHSKFKIQEERDSALTSLQNQAAKMIRLSNNRQSEAEAGMTPRVPVLDVD
ncbi:hypothetical protein QAD02_006326 [Eretmocerus hayati]|uniref:Uncharacterized protein n=1 Tax=Eretmocerus hayati TaxID=131215 RepID=A0ACC2N0X3_9HYME|nr:hypothetical protein QAD02_006326 [Eretmocerus hayati]